jgi:glycosyltransferase involved in cell wall biosynthesis
VFDDLFAGYPLFFERDSSDSLAERLSWFATLGAAERAEIGRTLRERVARNHSVETWADGVLAAAA